MVRVASSHKVYFCNPIFKQTKKSEQHINRPERKLLSVQSAVLRVRTKNRTPQPSPIMQELTINLKKKKNLRLRGI